MSNMTNRGRAREMALRFYPLSDDGLEDVLTKDLRDGAIDYIEAQLSEAVAQAERETWEKAAKTAELGITKYDESGRPMFWDMDYEIEVSRVAAAIRARATEEQSYDA